MASLAGQWIGKSTTDGSLVIVDLDDAPAGTRGTGRIFFSDDAPGAICEIELPPITDEIELERPLCWITLGFPQMVDTAHIRELHQDREFPDTAVLRIKKHGERLLLAWSTSIGTKGEVALSRPDMVVASELKSRELSWSEFKEFALSNTAGAMIFRGQPKRYKLRTAFHRTYRKDLVRYVADDIPTAHRQLTARTRHLFDMGKPPERGAFWNLLQHHGYPTPLLDWTYSPFVAAFFAYRRRTPSSDEDRRVRILAFDREKWLSHFNQLDAVNFVRPHFSLLEALAVENPRAIPQQAVSTLTNVDDIEAYIREKEAERGQTYLHAVDLEADIRPQVMAELSLMGITAGSLFPGLDGACEELMGRFFHHQVPPHTTQGN